MGIGLGDYTFTKNIKFLINIRLYHYSLMFVGPEASSGLATTRRHY